MNIQQPEDNRASFSRQSYSDQPQSDAPPTADDAQAAHASCRKGLNRREFLVTGVAGAALAGLPRGVSAEEGTEGGKEKADAPATGALPRRPLGRTGEQVTILNLGAGREPNPRLLNAAFEAGIRYIDTADCYAKGGSEKAIGDWLEKSGHRREMFIVTKDHPDSPDAWIAMLDRRLEALKLDFVDAFFLHALGDELTLDVPKAKEWAAAGEKLKKSGKVRFVGFSTHSEMDKRIALLNNAATGGWVDVLMLAYDPKTAKENAEFNKALDACHKAGIGLVCMKEMRALGDVPKFLPEFEEMGLTPHQAVLHAVWSDERIASICSDMPNLPILTENAAAARNFKPLDDKQFGAVLNLYGEYALGYCNGCDGRCRRAAGTDAALGDITRYLSYYERDGRREHARELYAALTPEQRDWHKANLAAASSACVSKLDFAALLARAESKLA